LVGKRGRTPKPPLTLAQILRWADLHRRHAGDWPTPRSGPIPAAPGLTWAAVDKALRRGGRGLPGRGSLARVLRRERGVAERRGRGRRNPARRRRVAELRARGLTLREIGEALGVSHQAVSQLLRSAQGEGKQP
jgi:hypothetical protein